MYHVKHAVPFTICPVDDGIVPSYQPVLVEPQISIPVVDNGSVLPPVPINLIQTPIDRLLNGVVLSQPSA